MPTTKAAARKNKRSHQQIMAISFRSQGDELQHLKRFHASGEHVLLEGPPGSGKSKLALEFLKGLGTSYERVNPGEARDGKDLLGRYTAGPNGTEKIEYQLARAARKGIPIFLDEISLLPTPVLSCLNPLADSQRCVTVFGQELKAAEGFWILGTYNPPAMNFTPSFRERFRHVRIDYLPAEMETQLLVDATGVSREDADFCSAVARLTRNDLYDLIGRGVSTRTLLEQAAKDLRDGWSRDYVVKEVIIRPLTDLEETRKAILQAVQAAGLFSIDEVRRLGLDETPQLVTPVNEDDFPDDYPDDDF